MRVFVLGGHGFCGWPTSLHLSPRGYDVTIIDNLSRRKIDIELGVELLTPIAPMDHRLEAWKEVADKEIAFHDFDISENYHRLLTLIQDEDPDAIIHFAEQRAAPYSMKSSWHNATPSITISMRPIICSPPWSKRRPTLISFISARWAFMDMARPG